MSENITFNNALNRLEEIAQIVQEKDMDLEKSLDFLEEGIELANYCTENIEETSLHN